MQLGGRKGNTGGSGKRFGGELGEVRQHCIIAKMKEENRLLQSGIIPFCEACCPGLEAALVCGMTLVSHKSDHGGRQG